MKQLINYPNHVWAYLLILTLIISPTGGWAAQQEQISINVKNVSVKDFIKQVGKLSNYELVFTSSDLNQKQKITYRGENKTVQQVLDETIKPLGLAYSIDKGIISIFLEQKKPSFGTTSSSTPASRRITGQVVDASNKQPLVGATVSIPSTNTKAITGQDGSFEIPVEMTTSTVSVSYLGYTTFQVPIASQTTLSVPMSPLSTTIEDAVVTGMFTRKQSTYTGAVTTLKAEDIERTGTLNIMEAISRLDPSFQLLVNDDLGSNPNALPDIQMRGASSFSDMKSRYTPSPNQPLFIIDGFEQSIERVFDMDMNRIASITLLKDATAKAIYGSKGANGVVVIETKKFKANDLWSLSF